MRIWIEISAPAEEGHHEVEVRLDSPTGTLLSSYPMMSLEKAPWVAPSAPDTPALSPLAELEEASGQISRGERGEDIVRKMGRHLYESLLGSSSWERIRRAARERGKRDLELALALPPRRHLHNLPWEAMHDGVSFLAADRHYTTAVTRVLRTRRSGDETDDLLPQVSAPARVLFVIGSEAKDPEIRAGIDVLGLLRGAERGPAGIDPQVVEAADIESLAAACVRFKPHIVHFVGHGRVKAGKGQLQLRGERLGETDWVEAERLLSALRGDGTHQPAVALLTGCDSAAAGEHIDPLAAALVDGGIPVALGMTGRISDRVCRLFARRFGIALSQGEPLVDALTSGRRAGLQHQADGADHDPAWALPSIYMDAGVPTDRPLVDISRPSPVISRVREYRLELEPVFCGRLGLVEQFDKLLDPVDNLNNLVVYTERHEREKLGKTRLLHEFAARALRRGHVVVAIDDIGEDISLLPRSFALLAVDMLQAILKARERFDLDVPERSDLVAEIERASEFAVDLSGADSPAYRRSRLGSFAVICRNRHEEIDGTLIEGSLKGLIAADLTRLAADARRAHPDTFGPDHRVVAILGGIGNWGEVTPLLCQQLLDVYGLGTKDEPVPVLATGAMADAPELLGKGLERAGPLEEVAYEQLGRFYGEEETRAYQTVLLHPSREKIGSSEPLPPYVPNFDSGNEVWRAALSDLLEGVPGNFREKLRWGAPFLAQANYLIEADEEAVMARYQEAQKNP